MTTPTKIPFYAKASLVFIGLFAFISMLFLTKRIILPIIYSTIIAIVLSPMVDFLVKKKMNRVLAIATAISLVSFVTILFVIVLASELSSLSDSFPKLVDKFYETLNSSVVWASGYFNISAQKINLYVADTKIAIMEGSRSSIGATLTTVGGMMIVLVLIPVYVFMLLFYQPLLLDFIRRLFGENNKKEVNEVLNSTKIIVRKYLVALLIEAAIIATLNSIGLLIIGIDYAIVLGIIGALVNVIPYIGGIIAVALPMIVAFVTKSSSSYALMVFVVYVVIQFIDNHYVVPKIVASKVKVNALISVIVVLAGGALWGVPGMFLSIPLTAILKVIFDHIEALKPWGFLLGDTMPVIALFKLKINKPKIN
ncbi:MAG: AI-2E family transporter [Bacteroidetes bacterium]|nr:AI-2E family transporter [Bacteroidota bacterium]